MIGESPASDKGIRISDHLSIPEEQLHWSFARSSGPGGQNVNKVNSKATMRWIPDHATFPSAVWNRFRDKAKRYLTSEGHVVIQSQEHRDQPQNVESCRSKLRVLLQASLAPAKRRIKTKPSLGARRRRLDDKRKNSDKKKSRQQRNFD